MSCVCNLKCVFMWKTVVCVCMVYVLYISCLCLYLFEHALLSLWILDMIPFPIGSQTTKGTSKPLLTQKGLINTQTIQ